MKANIVLGHDVFLFIRLRVTIEISMKKYIFGTFYLGIIVLLYVFRTDIAALFGAFKRDAIAPRSITITELKEQQKVEADFTIPKVQKIPMEQKSDVVTTTTPITPPSIPVTFNLDIPFTSQAPHSNWDLPYQETCEEASSLMAKWFIDGVKSKTKDEADQEILALVDWENKTFGDYKDMTIAQVHTILNEYFKLSKVYIIENPTIDAIKRAVAEGYPVIVPASGKLLGNPNFRNGGPPYHMFVVRGYTNTQFITNDPGTRNGKNYAYEFATVMNALHDWNNGDVLSGKKSVIVVKY